MRLEHHLVGGYVRYISPHIIIIINSLMQVFGETNFITVSFKTVEQINMNLKGKFG